MRTAAAEAEAEDSLFLESNCPTYPNPDSEFEKAVSLARLEEAFRRLPSGGSYGGMPLGTSGPNGESAASTVHRHIACALTLHQDFAGVFSGGVNAAYLTISVRCCVWIHGLSKDPLRHRALYRIAGVFSIPNLCTSDDQLLPFFRKVDTHEIEGNKAYAAFGDFAFGDRSKLLTRPDLLGRQDVAAWVAALWHWTRERPYGYDCEHWPLGRGMVSPHRAMQSWDSSLPAAEVTPLLQAVKDYPTDEPSLAAVATPFGGLGLALSVILGEAACCPPAVGALRRSQEVPQTTRQQWVTPHKVDETSTLLLPADSAGQQTQQEQLRQQQEQKQFVHGGLPPAIPGREQAARFDAILAGKAVFLEQEATAEGVAPVLGAGAPGAPFSAIPLSRVLLPINGPQENGSESPVSPLTAAAFEGLFLSLLSLLLPPKPIAPQPDTGDTANEGLAIPNPLAPQATLPLPGARDCIGVFLPEDGEAPGPETEALMPFRRFCFSLTRGCPALSGWGSPEAASQGDLKEETEEGMRLTAADTLDCRFSCYAANDAAVAARGEAPSAAAAPAVLEEEGTYISKKGIGCAFICP
ncbi:chitinase class [Cyclospora cayetanensis]|uniref:Chitinase class n=1 Tax=Cyclospora cayetanensis TaxID=88456 RepID=A0A1D3CR17_9EIME|nr:chitinase class [Cyclospora cayetanensis]